MNLLFFWCIITIIVTISILVTFVFPVLISKKICKIQTSKKITFGLFFWLFLALVSITITISFIITLWQTNESIHILEVSVIGAMILLALGIFGWLSSMIYKKLETNFSKFFGFCVLIIAISLSLSVITKISITSLIVPFQVSGSSMYPTIYDKEILITKKNSELQHNDIVVFTPNTERKQYFLVKRIIAMPGDKLKIENGNVYLQKKGESSFHELGEIYLNTENKGHTYTTPSSKTYTLGKNDFFLMGDNRNHSTDSRECFGSCSNRNEFVKKEDIVGKVFFDLGYFDLKTWKFKHPYLGIDTSPKFFDIK